MKKKAFLSLVPWAFVILFLGCSHQKDLEAVELSADKKIQRPSVMVSKERCDFVVPIAKIDKTWVWGASRPNEREYSWLFAVTADDETYQMGFTYFNHPDAVKQNGTFPDLVQAGQADIWKIDHQGGTNVGSLNVSTDGNNLHFWLDDKKWVDRLFLNRPNSVIFEAGGSQIVASKQNIPVIYTR